MLNEHLLVQSPNPGLPLWEPQPLFAAHGMMAPVGGPLANFVATTVASDVKEITHMSISLSGLPVP